MRICMESVKYLLISGKRNERKIDYKFMSQNISSNKTRAKFLLFRFSKKLFFRLKGIAV